MASPILFLVEDALVRLIGENPVVQGLMVVAADGSEAPIVVAPAMTAEGMDESRITCEAQDASSQPDRVRAGNFDVVVNVHVVTAISEASVPADGRDADEDGQADSPPLTIDMDALRDRHQARVSAVHDVLWVDSLVDDLSSQEPAFGLYGYTFQGQRQRVEGPFFIYTLSLVLRGCCQSDIEGAIP